MSEVKENTVSDDKKNGTQKNGTWIWVFLILMFGFGRWGSCDNPQISESEKKAARLEGQMSMIGGKNI